MDMLKKELAPLTSRAWEEIEGRAKGILQTRLSARKIVKVNGPKGWDYTVVPEGRLDLVDETGDVKTGVYRVSPLTEARVRFTLNRWEMDNLGRGAKDIDFDALDAAVDKIADFEEKAVYSGFKAGGIVGLTEAAAHKPVFFGADGSAIMEAVATASVTLHARAAREPYALVVGTKAWMALNREIHGMPLIERIERLLGGKVVHSIAVNGAFLLPYDDENLELTIGQDFAVGYESHDTREVTLFITESFTFRVLDPNVIVPFTV